MEITDIEVICFDSGDPLRHLKTRWADLVRKNNPTRIALPKRELMAIRIITDEGPEGMVVANTRKHLLAEVEGQLRKALIGEDPLLREAIWQKMYAIETPRLILSAADIGLWDLAGRLADMPCWQLAGGCRTRAKCYVTPHPDFGTPDDYAEHAVACKARGYGGYKIHGYLTMDPKTWEPVKPWSRSFPDADLDICRAVREAVGDDWLLMLDPAYIYSFEDSVRVAHELEKLGFGWFESPMWEDDEWMDRYVELRKQVDITIVAPETNPGYHFARARWIEAGASDISRIDHYFGGITSCLKTAALCEAHNMRLELHSTATNGYNLQVLGATTEKFCTFLETYDLDPEGGENFVGSSYLIGRRGKKRPPWIAGQVPKIDADGYADIPTEPGAGITIDWDYVRANAV